MDLFTKVLLFMFSLTRTTTNCWLKLKITHFEVKFVEGKFVK